MVGFFQLTVAGSSGVNLRALTDQSLGDVIMIHTRNSTKTNLLNQSQSTCVVISMNLRSLRTSFGQQVDKIPSFRTRFLSSSARLFISASLNLSAICKSAGSVDSSLPLSATLLSFPHLYWYYTYILCVRTSDLLGLLRVIRWFYRS